jgi:hypothetical protein
MSDKVKYVLNPFTGQFDAVVPTDFNKILTHQRNSSGNPLVLFDPQTGVYVDLGDLIVTDEEGNVVTT